jgi:tRNA pseudouridine38-40 synthase
VVTKLTIEYDGTAFAGWARQPDKRTVQEDLERALRTVLGADGLDGRPLALTVAGRTDAGVHAWGQVASYAHEAVDPQRLNALLDGDVAVLAAEPAPEGFNARRDAVSRTYCYRVLARRTRSVFERSRAYWWTAPVDRDALHECAAALVGRHDFTAFTPTETEHSYFNCTVGRAEWRAAVASGAGGAVGTTEAARRDGELLEFWIEADMFLRHMNRVLVGTMLDVARGASTVAEFRELLDGRPRSLAGRTAPAHGLALASVAYDER